MLASALLGIGATMPAPDPLESLRAHIAQTIQRATGLGADLEALDEGLQLLIPSLGDLAAAERAGQVATLCGFDEALPEKLRQLAESLADVLAGLTTADGAVAWLERQLSRLETDDETTA